MTLICLNISFSLYLSSQKGLYFDIKSANKLNQW